MASKRKKELSPSSYPSAKFFALLQKAWGVVVLEAKELEARSAHLEVEVSRDREGGITNA